MTQKNKEVIFYCLIILFILFDTYLLNAFLDNFYRTFNLNRIYLFIVQSTPVIFGLLLKIRDLRKYSNIEGKWKFNKIKLFLVGTICIFVMITPIIIPFFTANTPKILFALSQSKYFQILLGYTIADSLYKESII